MCRVHICLLTNLKLLLLLTSVLADSYYVTPTPSTQCPKEGDMPCFTLSQLAKLSVNFSSNNTLTMLPGNHSLELGLFVANSTILTISADNTSNSDTVIYCTQSAKFGFENINIVILRGLVLIGCVNNYIISVEQFTLKDCNLYGDGSNGTGLVILDVSSAQIVTSSFSFFTEFTRGGAALAANKTNQILIYKSIFTNNIVSGDDILGGAVYIASQSTTSCFAIINSSSFINDTVIGNKLSQGAALTALDCNITLNNSYFQSNRALGFNALGGAVYIASQSTTSCFAIINSSSFINNTAIGNKLSLGAAITALDCNITLNNSYFQSNRALGFNVSGGAVYIASQSTMSCFAKINSSSFINNTAIGNGTSFGGAVTTINLQNNSLFDNNSALGPNPAGRVVASQFTTSCFAIIHSSSFINNTAIGNDTSFGGAVTTVKYAIIQNNSLFDNNQALGPNPLGGAVFNWDDLVSVIHNLASVIDNSVSIIDNSVSIIDILFSVIENSVSIIENSVFTNNIAYNTIRPTCTSSHQAGGAVFTTSFISIINNSEFINNSARNVIGGAFVDFKKVFNVPDDCISTPGIGGAVFPLSLFVTINNSEFINNSADSLGGALTVAVLSQYVTIHNSAFYRNSVSGYFGLQGGAICILSIPNIEIASSKFIDNTATGPFLLGGVVSVISSTSVAISESEFINNTGISDAGLAGELFALLVENLTLTNCTFAKNIARGTFNAVIILIETNLTSYGFLNILENSADTFALTAEESTMYFLGNITISNNTGLALEAHFCSTVLFGGHANIVNNTITSNFKINKEAGTITVFYSVLTFNGTTNIMYNTALHGGAIYATQSSIFLLGKIAIAYNEASISGGGIYVLQSNLFLENTNDISLTNNEGNEKGGGIHAVSSILKAYDGSKIYIARNYAKKGGGVCLESNSKLYIIKISPETEGSRRTSNNERVRLEFRENLAILGGAVYITDDTNSVTCNAISFSGGSTTSNECFVQGLGIRNFQHATGFWDNIFRNVSTQTDTEINLVNTYFSNNTATVAGSLIYGGLLDRCTVNPRAEILLNGISPQLSTSLIAITYLLNITNIEDYKEISSDAVRMCFCKDSRPDCSYKPQPVSVHKGQTFSVSLVAVDQVNHTISNTTINSYVYMPATFGEGQSIQRTNINGSCTNLFYSIFTSLNMEQLFLYANGPCMSAGISLVNITVNIVPCPVGFIAEDVHCECDPRLGDKYIYNCSIDDSTVMRREGVWFAYLNVSGYLRYEHCPFDYCIPSPVPVNLNIPNGSDAQCAFNRSGKLCGSCKDGFSLSLGSSRCLQCSNNWLALLIVFAIAGIALVAFILVWNLTIAVGTINGLIFYANIIAANRAIFLPFEKPNVLTIFISWLNLDFGFETCFYNGMDGYTNTWLQLAFPLYIFLLVIAIIIISDHSIKFTVLFTKGKNPIATLATLILLSYTKLIRTVIASLSFTTVEGSQELGWLIDANVPYLKGKHIPLFITAVIIIILSMAYTLLLFGWQWICMWCPNIWITKNAKFNSFMNSHYDNPYKEKHRYWIGLLLLVRVVLYLIFAVNVPGDPRINLLSINSAVVIICLLQVSIADPKIHKTRVIRTLEIISLSNLFAFTSITLYIAEHRSKESQAVVAYISTSVAFILFLVILTYHTCVFVLKRPFKKIKFRFKKQYHSEGQPNNEITTNDYNNEEFSVTEFNGLPEPLDTDEDQSQTLETENDELSHYVKQDTPNYIYTSNNWITKRTGNACGESCNKTSDKFIHEEMHPLACVIKPESSSSGLSLIVQCHSIDREKADN